MTAVTYTAKRSIIASHTISTQYVLDIGIKGQLDPFDDVNKSEQVALSGKREALYWSDSSGLSLTIGSYPERSAQIDAVLEFLDSVKGGESFQFDRFGTADSPDLPVNAVMVGGYRRQRYLVRPGEGTHLMRFSFRIEFV